MIQVEWKYTHKRGGFDLVRVPRQFTNLKSAKDYAVEQVRNSPPEDMLRASVVDGGKIKYRCWIDEAGRFAESGPV